MMMFKMRISGDLVPHLGQLSEEHSTSNSGLLQAAGVPVRDGSNKV